MEKKDSFKNRIKKIVCVLTALVIGSGILGTTVVYGAPVQDDYQEIRKRFLEFTTGGEYEETDIDAQQVIVAINEEAKLFWSTMNKDPKSNANNGCYKTWGSTTGSGGDSSKDYLWQDCQLGYRGVHADSGSLHWTYQNLRMMALAYSTRGGELYRNSELKTDILTALEYLYQNHFNEKVPNYANWFAWGIGAPLNLLETVLLMYDEIPEAARTNYVYSSRRYGHNNMWGAANSLWQLRTDMYAAILLGENGKGLFNSSTDEKTGKEIMELVKTQVPKWLGYVTNGDGFYADGTYLAHCGLQGPGLAYNGGYGYTAIGESAYMTYMLRDTPWAVTDQVKINSIFTQIYDSYQPITYKGMVMDSFRSREIGRSDVKSAAAGMMVSTAMVLAREFAEPEDVDKIDAILKNWYLEKGWSYDQFTNMKIQWYKSPLYLRNKVKQILEDDTIIPIEPEKKIYEFKKGDRIVAHKEDFIFELAMASNKVTRWEKAADQNILGWNTPSGMTTLYLDQDEMLGKRDNSQKPTMDWNRLTGTTSVYGLELAEGNGSGFGKNHMEERAGGVNIQPYAAAAMQLKPTAKEGGIGLEAKKAWFVFDDEIVALGNDIRSTKTKGSTETTFENYITDETLYIDGQASAKSGEKLEMLTDEISYINIGDQQGFYFPNKETVNVKRETRTGTWGNVGSFNNVWGGDKSTHTGEYITLWKDHGIKPTDGSYAYVILPNKGTEATKEYATDSDITILQNDKEISAVYEKNLNITSAIFWQNKVASLDTVESVNYLSSDKSAAIMVKEDDKKLELAISDFADTKAIATIQLNRAATGVLSKDDSIEVIETSPTIKLRIDMNGTKGENQKISLSYEPPALPGLSEILAMNMLDGNLVIDVRAVLGASEYKLYYGKEMGNYDVELTSSSPQFIVPGLDINATYYFVVSAVNSSGESMKSAEQAFEVPAVTVFVDEMLDKSKMYQSSSNIVFQSDAVVGGADATLAKRDTLADGNIIYKLNGIQGFEITGYKHIAHAASISAEVSQDGINWNPVTLTETPTSLDSYFSRVTIGPQAELEETYNYLKIILKGTGKAWCPLIGQVKIDALNQTKDKIVEDNFIGTTNIFSSEGVDIKGGKAVAGAEGGHLVYSFTDIDEVEIEAGGNMSLEVSSDGSTYQSLSASDVPEGMNYLKVSMDHGTELRKVKFQYKNRKADIEQIRIELPDIMAVKGYKTEIGVKKAPANAMGTFIYESNDEEIATVHGGMLEGIAAGKTNVSVSLAQNPSICASTEVRIYEDATKAATASSDNVYGSYSADKAIDRNLMAGSKWQSNSTGDPTLNIKLSKEAKLSNIDIFWDIIGGEYSIETSIDQVSWETCFKGSQTTGKYVNIQITGDQKANYVRVCGEKDKEYSIIELRALSEMDMEEDKLPEVSNIALGQTAVAEAWRNDGTNYNVADCAVDGGLDTRWDVEQKDRRDSLWWMVDLGELSTITGININFQSAYGKEYKVLLSEDETDWTDAKELVHETNGKVDWNYYTLNQPKTGRYVKFQGIKRGTQYGYGIQEFEVMGYNDSSQQLIEVESVSLNRTEAIMVEGGRLQLTAETVPEKTTSGSIEWITDNSRIATVKNGMVTAGKPGTTMITVRSTVNPEKSAKCVLTVVGATGIPIPVESVEIENKPSGMLEASSTYTLKAVVKPEKATNKHVTWKSSDESIAKVDSLGNVTMISVGSVEITARSVVSEFQDTAMIQVKDADTAYAITLEACDATVMTEPGDQAIEGTNVFVKISDIPEDKAVSEVTVYDGEIEKKAQRIVNDNVPEGESWFQFIMPAKDISIQTTLSEFYTEKIVVTKLPNKTTYTMEESFSQSGMEVTAYQVASSSDAIRRKNVLESTDYQVIVPEFDSPGTKCVEIEYWCMDAEGNSIALKDEFNINVSRATEYYTECIKITKKPTKTSYYIGEDFNPEGMQVKEYQKSSPSNATRQNILEEDDYELTYDFSRSGSKSVTITYWTTDKNGDDYEFKDTLRVMVRGDESESDEADTSYTKEQQGPGIDKNVLNSTWKKDKNGWWLQLADGTYPKATWLFAPWNQKADWYFFNEQGYMYTGWLEWNKAWYYLHTVEDGAYGHMYTGWKLIDGKWYYFNAMRDGKTGSMLENAVTPDGFYVGLDGVWDQTKTN